MVQIDRERLRNPWRALCLPGSHDACVCAALDRAYPFVSLRESRLNPIPSECTAYTLFHNNFVIETKLDWNRQARNTNYEPFNQYVWELYNYEIAMWSDTRRVCHDIIWLVKDCSERYVNEIKAYCELWDVWDRDYNIYLSRYTNLICTAQFFSWSLTTSVYFLSL